MHELCVGHLHQGRLGHPWVVARDPRDLGPPVSAAAAEAKAGAPALATVALTAASTAVARASLRNAG